MDLWSTRTESLAAISGVLQDEGRLVSDLLSVLAASAEALATAPESTPLSRVAGICIVKSRNLGLASFSLCLDALAQEAGAVMRPLVECVELLAYVRASPSHLQQAIDGRLPNAGTRARIVDGNLQEWRDHFNAHSSHFRLTPESVRHLLNSDTSALRIVQPYSQYVLRENLRSLSALLLMCALEAIRAVDECAPHAAPSLATEGERLRGEALRMYLTVGQAPAG
jgi:hypothetical protein